MAVITKYYLMEQVRNLLASGDPSAAAKFEPRVIWAHLEQAINKRLKTEYFAVTLPGEETIPEGMVLATYDNVPVVAYKDRSRSALPVIPISLRRNMGIFHVSLTEDLDNPFIPLQAGQNSFVKTQSLINTILGQVGYEYSDGYVVYTEDLTARAIPVTEVFMRLVVSSLSKYTDYDMLPLAADMAGDVITEVYSLLAPTPPAVKIVDPINKPA